MPTMPPTFRSRGVRSKAERDREHDALRRGSQPWRVWYSQRVWREARAAQLSREPLCRRCAGQGRIVVATVVNHIIAHRGDWALFCDPANHESVCKTCHDGLIQSEERTGGAVKSLERDTNRPAG